MYAKIFSNCSWLLASLVFSNANFAMADTGNNDFTIIVIDPQMVCITNPDDNSCNEVKRNSFHNALTWASVYYGVKNHTYLVALGFTQFNKPQQEIYQDYSQQIQACFEDIDCCSGLDRTDTHRNEPIDRENFNTFMFKWADGETTLTSLLPLGVKSKEQGAVFNAFKDHSSGKVYLDEQLSELLPLFVQTIENAKQASRFNLIVITDGVSTEQESTYGKRSSLEGRFRFDFEPEAQQLDIKDSDFTEVADKLLRDGKLKKLEMIKNNMARVYLWQFYNNNLPIRIVKSQPLTTDYPSSSAVTEHKTTVVKTFYDYSSHALFVFIVLTGLLGLFKCLKMLVVETESKSKQPPSIHVRENARDF